MKIEHPFFTHSWSRWAKENTSYKLVALFVTLVLWISVKGEKDIVYKNIPLEYRLAENHVIANSIVHSVRVEVMGSRVAIKKFTQDKRKITIDLTQALVGKKEVFVSRDEIDLPNELRILSIVPDSFIAHIRRLENENVKEGHSHD